MILHYVSVIFYPNVVVEESVGEKKAIEEDEEVQIIFTSKKRVTPRKRGPLKKKSTKIVVVKVEDGVRIYEEWQETILFLFLFLLFILINYFKNNSDNNFNLLCTILQKMQSLKVHCN